jgi:hypothetical protein
MTTDTGTTPAIDVRPEGKVRTTLGTAGKIIALVVTLTGAGVAAWVWAMADIRTLNSDRDAHAQSIRTIDSRVRALEAAQTDIAVMKNDVQWIRQTIERQERTRDRP